MTMPVNNLETRIKAPSYYNRNVVTALQSIDGVTDVKPFYMSLAFPPMTQTKERSPCHM